MIGILPTSEALLLARKQGLDLVEIAPNAEPPVCSITDYGKFLYEAKCREKEMKKKQHSTSVREIRFSMKIDEHDYQVKLKKIKEFLEKRNRVRITLVLRGREVVHSELGIRVLERLIKDLESVAKVEGKIQRPDESRPVTQIMLIPK